MNIWCSGEGTAPLDKSCELQYSYARIQISNLFVRIKTIGMNFSRCKLDISYTDVWLALLVERVSKVSETGCCRYGREWQKASMVADKPILHVAGKNGIRGPTHHSYARLALYATSPITGLICSYHSTGSS